MPKISTFRLVFLSKVTGSQSTVCMMVRISCAMPIAGTQKLLSVLKWLSELNMELLAQFILDSPYKKSMLVNYIHRSKGRKFFILVLTTGKACDVCL